MLGARANKLPRLTINLFSGGKHAGGQVPIQYVLAFSVAILLNQGIKGQKFFRVAFLVPFMISPVAVGWMVTGLR